MNQHVDLGSAQDVASAIDAEIHALSNPNTPNVRKIRRKYTKLLKLAEPDFIMVVARELLNTYDHRWVAYELIREQPATFQRLDEATLEALGQGIDSWWTVDAFARTLSGPAWLEGQITDAVIHRWAKSEDVWWRRAALVSTVALNVRTHGGYGDVSRTLEVCRMLVNDHEDMVVKALSWALRALVVHDPEAVQAFLDEHENVLAARVKREVWNKLTTGLKNPKTDE